MTAEHVILVGTRKGAFVVEPVAGGARIRGPFCGTMPVQHVTWDPATRTLLAGAGSPWYGPTVWRSTDLGDTWSQSSEGLTYGEGEPAVTRVWNVTPAHGELYAGVEPAGLFRSRDGGVTWEHVAGLRAHPSTPDWQPGNGGLILHSIVPHPTDPDQIWVGISAVGTFHTSDRGATWVAQNQGVRAGFLPDPHPETGQCVHKLARHPSRPEVLFQQNHCGVYRTDDGGSSWVEITAGLPSEFGFPMVVHPTRPSTAYVIPLNGDDRGRYVPDGSMAVWRTQDDGTSWQRLSSGLPPRDAYVGILREAMATDQGDPASIYFGTSTGQLYGSADDGETWRLVASHLPGISSVETAVISA